MGDEDESLLESIRLAIQAQEEIRQELLSEVRTLESQARPHRTTIKMVAFYSASMRHVVSDKSAVLEQIAKFKTVTLPELRQQLDRINQRRETIQKRIETVQMARNRRLLKDLDIPDKVHAVVAELTQKLLAEIHELTLSEAKIKANTSVARADLRVLQDQSLNKQREKTCQAVADEVADERGLFLTRRSMRRRSNTQASLILKHQADRRQSLIVKRPMQRL
jgi:hypothetical protein